MKKLKQKHSAMKKLIGGIKIQKQKVIFVTLTILIALSISSAASATDTNEQDSNFSLMAAPIQGQAGTTLKNASVTATPLWETPFTWTIEKTGPTEEYTVNVGDSITIPYNVTITNTQQPDIRKITGIVNVTNGGDKATENLNIILDLYKKPDGGGYTTFVGSYPVDVSSNPVLDPEETGIYPYTIELTDEQAQPSSGYKISANITITNHSGRLGQPFGPSPDTTFIWPSQSTLIDEAITVKDTYIDLNGVEHVIDLGTYSTDPTLPGTTYVEPNSSYQIPTQITIGPFNTLGGPYPFTNTASFVTTDTGATGSDSWTVNVYVMGAKGTLTIGYWKTHTGLYGNNKDVVTPLLGSGIWLGTPDGAKSVLVTSAEQARELLSMSGDASNGINKLYAQLLAAKLNIANGADGSSISTTIVAADEFLATHNASDWSSLTKKQKQEVLKWAYLLDQYNNGY